MPLTSVSLSVCHVAKHALAIADACLSILYIRQRQANRQHSNEPWYACNVCCQFIDLLGAMDGLEKPSTMTRRRQRSYCGACVCVRATQRALTGMLAAAIAAAMAYKRAGIRGCVRWLLCCNAHTLWCLKPGTEEEHLQEGRGGDLLLTEAGASTHTHTQAATAFCAFQCMNAMNA